MSDQNTLGQDELDQAQNEEQAELSKSQNDYFLRRLILLRAQLNRTVNELQQTRTELGNAMTQLGELRDRLSPTEGPGVVSGETVSSTDE